MIKHKQYIRVTTLQKAISAPQKLLIILRPSLKMSMEHRNVAIKFKYKLLNNYYLKTHNIHQGSFYNLIEPTISSK
jgi:hypothetical protein